MSTFDDILNFIMPIAVFGFIGFIIYRVPLVKKGVDALIDKLSGVKERMKGGNGNTKTINSLQYE